MKRQSGFTLVELMVVIAVVSVLAALLLPALERAIAAAKLTSCANQQRQIGLAASLYANDYNSYWPSSLTCIKGFGTVTNCAALSGEGWYAYDGDLINRAGGAYLFEGEYVQDYRLYFCPGLAIDNVHWDTLDLFYTANFNAWKKRYYTGVSGAYYRVGYVFRNSGANSKIYEISPERDSALEMGVFLCDVTTGITDIGPGGNRQYEAHRDGYNILFFDVSCQWYPDPGWQTIDLLGQSYGTWLGTLQPLFFYRYLDKTRQ